MRKFVLRQNVVGMTTPPVLRGVQSLVGMTGTSDVTAAARWGAVLGLTAFWFIGTLRLRWGAGGLLASRGSIWWVERLWAVYTRARRCLHRGQAALCCFAFSEASPISAATGSDSTRAMNALLVFVYH